MEEVAHEGHLHRRLTGFTFDCVLESCCFHVRSPSSSPTARWVTFIVRHMYECVKGSAHGAHNIARWLNVTVLSCCLELEVRRSHMAGHIGRATMEGPFLPSAGSLLSFTVGTHVAYDAHMRGVAQWGWQGPDAWETLCHATEFVGFHAATFLIVA